jgi:hypothetical protein
VILYTVNWVDYYYKFFTGKNDVNVSDQDLYPPLSLYPEYVSYIKAEDIEKKSSINVSWEKDAIDLSCSSLKTYTFDVVLSM